MIKRIVVLTIMLMIIFGVHCIASAQITGSADENKFVQYYATEDWLNPGIYRIEGRITKHIQENGEALYWLHVNARGRDDGFTTKAQIIIGDKTYSLKCVDVISSKYRSSMSNKSRSFLTQIQEFYDIDTEVINEILLTSKPIYLVVNFKNRSDVQLAIKGSFLDCIKELSTLSFKDKEKYLK